MPATLNQLAELVGGEVLGDRATLVSGAATLDHARAGDITLIDSAERTSLLNQTQAAAAIVPPAVNELIVPVIVVSNVHQAFARVVSHFRPPRQPSRIGVSPQAIVALTARLGTNVDVHPLAVIEDDVEISDGVTIHAGVHVMAGCRIAANVTIMPRVVLYDNTVVGPRTLIHAGAVIGANGFGYDVVGGRHEPCAQLGNVEIGADVEIGASTTIDRGTYGATVIGDGTKIDNLVQIAHNCRIGRHNMICSQVGIAGSTTTGDYVVLAGQVGVRDHVRIGDRAVVGAKAGVSNDVPDDARVFGCPAQPERHQKLIFAAVSKLPQMRKDFKALQADVARLEAERESATPK